jgi:hypothetical protein
VVTAALAAWDAEDAGAAEAELELVAGDSQ